MIRITPADSAFSKCVRERAGWACERCGAQHNESSTGLHCSHHHGRGNWAIRFEPTNAESLCYGCHSKVGGTQERREQVLTKTQQDILFEMKRDEYRARTLRKTKGKGDIAKHFREQFKAMRELRMAGETGRIEFEGYL